MTEYPKQLRLTFKQQREGGTFDYGTWKWVGGTELPPLGFMQVYEPHLKTFAKKQATQDNWAYGLHHYNEEGLVVRAFSRWIRKPGEFKASEMVQGEEIVEEHLQPRIITNTPLEGFRLVKSVNRYSTSNKLWRVLDPRGFELEISTANLEELMMDCVIDHGLIKAECVWQNKAYLMRTA